MCQDLVFHRDLQIFLAPGRAGQTEFLNDTTSQACLADGHQPQGPPPFFPGERPPGGEPAFLAPGKREWPPTSPQRWPQQAAEDLLWIIECFANCADMIGRSTYKALDAIFNRQCEVREGKVVVKAETGGDCIQNPSDADATYDAHTGPEGATHFLAQRKRGWPPTARPGNAT